ncbi:MAG: Spy/CpxP family protein refolding chaperone [Nitrospirae bacterium]|nr:Spy/CpxP family protein refolding chaperone [Nitrospirota bacterium]
MIKKIAVILAVVSLVAFAALAYGEMGGRGMGMGPGMSGGYGMGAGMGCGMDGKMMDSEHHMAKIMKGLNLDEQQKAFMNEIKSRMKKETIRRTADMRIVQIELKELLMKDQVDMTAVEAKVRQLETMKTEMHLSHIQAMEDCKAKLTPEQRKKFREMIEAEPMMEGMGKGMKGKRGGAKRGGMKEKTE